MALKLDKSERLAIIEGLNSSLDQPDPEIDKLWAEEALRRARAYDEGRLETVSLEEALRDD
jgi:putative addiction module component (TIGR02574 family)